MKKTVACLILLICLLTCSLRVCAMGINSYEFTMLKNDMNGENYQVYISGASGQYDAGTDSVTLYFTNTSDHEFSVQMTVGWEPSTVKTKIDSGYLTVQPEVTAAFTLEGLSEIPEKSNDELGYVPGRFLGANSVIRFQIEGVKENDTFVVSGINGYKVVRDSAFSVMEPEAVKELPLQTQYVTNARKVISVQPSGEEKDYSITAETPKMENVNKFFKFIACSAVLCAGGLIIYIVTSLMKWRRQHERT